eukprot:gene28978-32166_t
MSARLSGRVAIVTGGAKGIGFACAKALALQGARVLIADVDIAKAQLSVAELEGQGLEAKAVKCIVKAAPFLEMTEEDFDDVLAVNLKGAFLSCQAAAKQMVKQVQEGDTKSKSIITMSSVNAVMAIPTIAGYNASKGGMNGLTKCMSLALAPHGIRVNGIGPGSINTEVLASVADNPEAMGRVNGIGPGSFNTEVLALLSGNPEAMGRILSRTPLGRIGEPDEVANVAAFLASDDASYVSGQILYVDGGRMALNYTVPPPAK